jgi:hypothetical protein
MARLACLACYACFPRFSFHSIKLAAIASIYSGGVDRLDNTISALASRLRKFQLGF